MPQKGTSTLRMRVCRQCGIEFMGGPRAWYCPTCRIDRQREQGRKCKQRQRKGQTRPAEKLCWVTAATVADEKEEIMETKKLVELFMADNC